jgi:FkbM family methyltransferase
MYPTRINSFYQRARAFAALGGWVKAIFILLRIKFLPTSVNSVSFLGFRVFFRREDEYAVREVLVNQEYAFLTDLVRSKSEPVIFDIGAHIGTFAIWALSTNPSAKVISVEADPNTYKILEQNRNEANEDRLKWQVLNAAAGSKDGEQLHFSDAGPSMSHRLDPEGKIRVQSVSLNTLIEKFAQGSSMVDLVKVDIEGAEAAFLSMGSLSKIGALVVELHPYLVDTIKLEADLRDAFPTVVRIPNRTSQKPVLLCSHTTLKD